MYEAKIVVIMFFFCCVHFQVAIMILVVICEINLYMIIIATIVQVQLSKAITVSHIKSVKV